jgi:hypothetical protein
VKRRAPKIRHQRGAALILFATVLVLGVAWYTVGALSKAPRTTAEREIATGQALAAAKRALLSYAAQYAARTDHDVPGRLPCPESLSSYGTSTEGQAASSCSNTTTEWGRLPWRTLGIDRPRDGDGEMLWYVLGPGFRSAPINFGSVGQLTVDTATNAAVALIIAPGAAVDTQFDPDTPPAGCTRSNQSTSRYATPLAPARFLECGNDTGSFVTTGTAKWFNDRVVAVTAAELMAAIAGPVADRLQRTVTPVLAAWDQTEQSARGKSWGTNWSLAYLPFAASFSNPATNDYCGDAGASPSREGLPPTASRSSGSCGTDWSGAVSLLLGLVSLGCNNNGTELTCTFLRLFAPAPFSARVTATAQNVAGSFRGTLAASDITVTGGGSATLSAPTISTTTGAATAVVDASWPVLGLFAVVQVRVPNLPDAVFMSVTAHSSYTSTQWFRDNNWHQFVYYGVAPGATVNPASACAAAGDPGCLTLNGLPASNGSADNKKLILTLMGPALATQSQPSNDPMQYLESHTVGTAVYTASTSTSTFNDRATACPFEQTTSGGTVTICN